MRDLTPLEKAAAMLVEKDNEKEKRKIVGSWVQIVRSNGLNVLLDSLAAKVSRAMGSKD